MTPTTTGSSIILLENYHFTINVEIYHNEPAAARDVSRFELVSLPQHCAWKQQS